MLRGGIGEAIKEVLHAEVFDKTFLLIITISIAWASHHSDDKEHEKEHHDEITGELKAIHKINHKDEHGHDQNDHEHVHGHITGYKLSPWRMIFTTSLGTIGVNIKSIMF